VERRAYHRVACSRLRAFNRFRLNSDLDAGASHGTAANLRSAQYSQRLLRELLLRRASDAVA
jgi:hypothetical protein